MSVSAREKLLDAALSAIRQQGYSATSADELCARAGVTKGAFFHHFKSKEALAVAAADHWSTTTSALFAAADYHRHADPLDRVLAYVGFRRDLIRGGIPSFTCLVGTMVQEAYGASDAIREACWRSIEGHAETFEADIAAAMGKYSGASGFSARSLALYTQASIQGAFIFAKASNDASVAINCVEHVKRPIELLFGIKETHQ